MKKTSNSRSILFICLLCLRFCFAVEFFHLPRGEPSNSDVDVDQNQETIISLRAAVPIPDSDEHGGQLLWPITVQENINLTDLTVENAYLTIRGMYHESSQDLRIALLHEKKSAILVDQRGDSRKYGVPTPRKYWDLSSIKQKRQQRYDCFFLKQQQQ